MEIKILKRWLIGMNKKANHLYDPEKETYAVMAVLVRDVGVRGEHLEIMEKQCGMTLSKKHTPCCACAEYHYDKEKDPYHGRIEEIRRRLRDVAKERGGWYLKKQKVRKSIKEKTYQGILNLKQMNALTNGEVENATVQINGRIEFGVSAEVFKKALRETWTYDGEETSQVDIHCAFLTFAVSLMPDGKSRDRLISELRSRTLRKRIAKDLGMPEAKVKGYIQPLIFTGSDSFWCKKEKNRRKNPVYIWFVENHLDLIKTLQWLLERLGKTDVFNLFAAMESAVMYPLCSYARSIGGLGVHYRDECICLKRHEEQIQAKLDALIEMVFARKLKPYGVFSKYHDIHKFIARALYVHPVVVDHEKDRQNELRCLALVEESYAQITKQAA